LLGGFTNAAASALKNIMQRSHQNQQVEELSSEEEDEAVQN
jgi:hypothetical protein